jgi:excisionase family DNA binding protein
MSLRDKRPPCETEEDTVELLSVTQAAQRLGISRATLYRLLAKGDFELRTINIGRRRLVPSSEIDRFIDTALNVSRDTRSFQAASADVMNG